MTNPGLARHCVKAELIFAYFITEMWIFLALSLVLLKGHSIHRMCTYSVPRPQLFWIQKSAACRFTPLYPTLLKASTKEKRIRQQEPTVLFSLFVLLWLSRRKNLNNQLYSQQIAFVQSFLLQLFILPFRNLSLRILLDTVFFPGSLGFEPAL